MADFIFYVVVGAAALLFAYLLVRVAAFAWFRTKWEFLRKTINEINRGD